MVSFAVLTPSRGLVHSRVVEAVMVNVAQASGAGHEFRGWCLTHNLPIPDCDEKVTRRGLATKADLLWFVEEDTVPPPGALLASIALLGQFDVVAVDYPVGTDAWACINRDESGEIRWCGLGTTLIRSEVFKSLPRPWFSTDWAYMKRGREYEPERNTLAPEKRYGQQDIYFCMNVRSAGFRIGQVRGMTAEHGRLVSMGKSDSNIGWHTMAYSDRILRQQP